MAFADQLNRGDDYHLLKPTVAVVWSVDTLFEKLSQLHSIFELRERPKAYYSATTLRFICSSFPTFTNKTRTLASSAGRVSLVLPPTVNATCSLRRIPSC